MKLKHAFISVVILGVMFWVCWSVAYQQGYSRGACDEFACWKQEPMAATSNWDGMMTGSRYAWLLPGGKPVPKPTVHIRNPGVNNITSSILP